jgi:hypothetical protein
LDGEMTDEIEGPFAARGLKRGGTLMFEAAVAYEVIAAAKLAARPILGIDCFLVTESTTTSPLEHVLDLSNGVAAGVDTWREARRFIKEREGLGFLFEVVV